MGSGTYHPEYVISAFGTAGRQPCWGALTDLHDPLTAARAAHLRYVNDKKPGISRTRTEDGWDFHDTDGSLITDSDTIARIKKLAIPPAYTDVWICRDPSGHLQAVGRDARGRKQYRYHAKWREVRDEAKYGKMLVVGRVLPAIRTRVKHDLALPGLPKNKVLAAIVALLEKTMMRIGNEEYARENESFGLTTLRPRHARVRGNHVMLDFRGKHGVEHHMDLADRQLARVVERCQHLPGQDLFHFLDGDGETHHVTSDDVNEYLREASGDEITAKDFRTWAATNLAALALADMERFDSHVQQKKGRGAGGRACGEATRQHPRHLPQVLHSPGGVRGLFGRLVGRRVKATGGRGVGRPCSRPVGARSRRDRFPQSPPRRSAALLTLLPACSPPLLRR